MPLPEEIGPQAVVSGFPRPNQAFWTLSVLWSGWLWGAEAALPLRNVLDRRRYDWNWHTSAIHNALAAVGWSIPAETPFFGLLPELAPGFLSAAVVAAVAAGFRLEGIAMRPDVSARADQELAQALWKPAVSRPSGSKEQARSGERAHNSERAPIAARAPQANTLVNASCLPLVLKNWKLPPAKQCERICWPAVNLPPTSPNTPPGWGYWYRWAQFRVP